MTIESGVICFLFIMLVVQQGFYMWMTSRLVNKLMSRNYAEYAQVNHVYKNQPQKFEMNLPLPNEEEQDRVRQLNSLMGMTPIP